MKNSKKMFILTETALALMVLILASVMIREKDRNMLDKVSVIVQNSDDTQWAAFKYGLKMAAEDHGIEMFVVSTEDTFTLEEEKSIIQQEIDNGSDAVIVQPVPGEDSEDMLKKLNKKVPVMLIEDAAAKESGKLSLPTTKPDNYAMGKALAEELLKDYSGKIDGKTLGIFSETADSEATISRLSGLTDGLKDTGAQIRWSVTGLFPEGSNYLEAQPKVDLVIALDNSSLITAGESSAAHNLHGALVYGIGNSTKAIHYLDTGIAECLVVPDEFNLGYQSLTEVAKHLQHYFHKMQDKLVSYTIIRRDTLFSKENQEILFTMSQ